MNSTPQFDLHPDADSLNAFAEQALAFSERELVLAHLAGCSRCRQVIFLALQAAVEADAPARAPAIRLTTQPSAWFWNWRLAWVPAAAMAAALALMVTFHPWRNAPTTEMAKATPPRDEAVPRSIPQEQVSAGTAREQIPALTTNSAPRNTDLAARHIPSEKLALATAPSAAFPAEPTASATSHAESIAVQPTSMFSAQQDAATQSQSEPAVAAWQQERQRATYADSASANTSQVSQKSMQMEAYSAHASRATAAGSAGPRMAQQSQAAPTGGSFSMGTQQLAGMSAPRKAAPPKLPSGLPVVSRATAQHLVLEIDRAGTLFLSDESGEHWETVVRQWTGRAIEVRVKTDLSGGAAPATGFELKNDAGSTWASADGKIWTAQ